LGSRRTVALTPLAIDALRAHMARRLAEGLRASPWPFPSKRGTAMNYRNLTEDHFEDIVKRAKIPRIRPYDLRHTYATLVRNAVRTISKNREL
jgi:integrase